jgi:methyl-accepting chemotaxis protein
MEELIMRWFVNLKMANKLKLGFSLCLCLSLISCVVAIGRLGQLNSNARTIVDDPLSGAVNIGKISSQIRMVRSLEFRNAIPGSQAKAAEIKEVFDKSISELNSALNKYESSASMQEDKSNITKLKQMWDDYKSGYSDVVALAATSKFTDAQALVAERREKFYALCDLTDSITAWNEKRGAALADEATMAYASGRNTMIVLLVISMLVIACVGTAITRSITSPVAQIMERLQSLRGICISNLRKAMDAMAQGDLTKHVDTGTKLLEIDTKDELGQIAQTLNEVVRQAQGTIESFHHAQTQLSQILAKARTSADSIAIAATEVAAGNDDLAQRTEEQAANLEQTASSMQEMTQSVRQNADNAKQANQMAMQARNVAERGGNVVNQAVKAMEEIDTTSKQVVDIITVIDEIAFQTNLLALNAAVEAARVGEQGKGFAVVAAEVRSLAARSATAAKEIKSLVQDSVAKVQEGCTLVNQSGDTLDEIVNSVKKVADIVAEISASCQEQSSGIEQTNKAITQMDQITQQNAALVEEAAAASTSMRDLSVSLQDDVNRFEISSSYLTSARAQTPVQTAQPMKATGTDGKPTRWSGSGSHKKTTPLVMSSNAADDFEAGFEEF